MSNMEASTVPLVCFWNGKLSNEHRDAQYVGGSSKAGGVSKNIDFTQFKQKIQSMMKLSSDQTDFKIKCGVSYDGNTLIATDVDDDDSLQYILGHSGTPLRAYIIKGEISRINTQREEALPAGDVHLGGNNFAMDAGDNNRGGWKENPIHHMDNLEERSCPLPAHETYHNKAENVLPPHANEPLCPVTNDFAVGQEFRNADTFREAFSDLAVRTKKEPYHLLPGLVKELDRQGWVTQLSCNKDKQFVYFFWAFRASIHAFRTHLRPILYIDTRRIRSGVLMVAYSIDGDGNEFFIAFGIFEEENEKWWEKFLNLLKELICPEVLPLVIVTKYDPKTTVVLVPKVFPKVNHCFISLDLDHVFIGELKDHNLQSGFCNIFLEKFNDRNLRLDMRSAAKSYETEECDRYLERIKEKNKDAYEWLLTVGKSCWSVAYLGFDIMCNRFHFDRWLGCGYDEQLITELIVWTRDQVAAGFLHGQRSGAKMTSRLNTRREYDLREAITGAWEARLEFGDADDEYQVFDKLESREFVVNLVNRTCSCGRFQVKGIPCKHAAGVIIRRKGDLDIDSFCQHWATADAYRGTYSGYTFEEPYDLIPWSIEELEGSGSCEIFFNCRADGSFVYCFWAFRACIHAFRNHLHPELFIETRPLRSRVLMSAHCVDGNNAALPVAFGIFEEENEKWWETFLNQLKEVIVGGVDLGRPWVIVTKFDPKTTAVLVPKIFPRVNHRFYLDDFYYYFQEKFKDDEDVTYWMKKAAESYKSEECDGYLERIKGNNEDAYDWLVLKVGKIRWTNSYSWAKSGFLCPDRDDCHIWDDVQNIFCEDFVDIEVVAISELMVRTTEMVDRNFLRRQRQGAQMTGKLTTCCETDLRNNIEYAQRSIIDDDISNGGTKDEYQVCDFCGDIHRVSLVNQTCTCGYFQRFGYPCRHAAAVITRDEDLDIYDYCKPWTTADAYRAMYAAPHFHPVPRIHYPSGSQVLPPKRKVGRPKKKKDQFL